MRKKLLLLSTFLISFIVYTGVVDAAKELTCNYGTHLLVQYSDGKIAMYEYLGSESGSIDDNLWKKQSDNVNLKIKNGKSSSTSKTSTWSNYGTVKYTEEQVGFSNVTRYSPVSLTDLISCPPCSELGSTYKNVKVGYWTENGKRCKNSASEPLLEKRESIPTFKEDWYGKCEYKINREKSSTTTNTTKVTVYFNEDHSESKIKENRSDSDSTCNNCIKEAEKDDFYENFFALHDALGGCPPHIYAEVQTITNTCDGGATEECGTKTTSKTYSAMNKGKITYDLIETNKKTIENVEDIESCEDLLSPDTIEDIKNVFKWIGLIAAILLLVMGIIDFLMATFSSSDEDMSKNKKKFLKRILAAVLLFIVPYFVTLVLQLANGAWDWINPETCINSETSK